MDFILFSARLVVSLSHRSRRQGSWVGDDILERRLLDALVLMSWNFATSKDSSRTKQR